jgi:hypothetical protein
MEAIRMEIEYGNLPRGTSGHWKYSNFFTQRDEDDPRHYHLYERRFLCKRED